MGAKYDLNKTSLELSISSSEVSVEEITSALGLEPDKSFKQGNLIDPCDASVGSRAHNLWVLNSPDLISSQESLSAHFDYFKLVLTSDRLRVLSRYKKDARLETVFSVWVETESAGIGFEFNEEESRFIDAIANRLRVSLLARKDVNAEWMFKKN